MFTKEEIRLLRENLKHFCSEYYEVLQESTGLSRTTVSKFLNYQRVSKKNQITIYNAALELVNTNRQIKEALISKTKQVLDL